MKSIARLLLVVSMVFFSNLSTAQSFRFTVSADNRPDDAGSRARFQWTISEMERLRGDEGVFHIMPGDFDSPQITDDDLRNEFGSETIWYPIVGNHEAETPADMTWVRDAYAGLPYIVNDGPSGSYGTTYSFDYGNAHFIALNEYFNGTVDDNAAGGDVCDALYAWLVADLDANTQPVVFVIGHEPAYPENRHVGDSLDQYPANRDRFWQLLNDRNVISYFCGHTHSYSTEQRSVSGEPASTWQVDVGNSGNGAPQTFVDVTVTDTEVVTFDVYQGDQDVAFVLSETWTVSLSAPVAGDDAYNVAPDTLLSVSAPGVLSNDTDPNQDSLEALLDTDASDGSLYLYSDGSFDYTPDPGFTGVDTFTYFAWDGANGSTVASVSIDVSNDVTLSFQHGVDAYSGTADTNLMENSPDSNWATASSLTVDADEPASSGHTAQALLRFDGILGAAPDQVPPDAQILSASLTLNTTNLGNGATLHRMLQTWLDTDTWNDWAVGIQPDDTESVAIPDLNTGAVSVGDTVLDVTSSVQAWADGQANHGWAFIPVGTDGWDFDSSEGTSPPLLSVTYSSVPPPNPPAAPTTLTSVGEPGQISLDWDDNSEPGLAGYAVYRSPDDSEYALINADSAQLLAATPITDSTGQKPQSKVWLHDGQWWCVLADTSGTWVRRLDGDTWTSVLQLSSTTTVEADCRTVGDVTHILLVNGASLQLASVEYVAGQPGTYQLWSVRPALVDITPSDTVETATIDMDSTGRLWCAFAAASNIEVRYGDSPYIGWSEPVLLETGVSPNDICVVTALPDSTVGVLWSNQNSMRFGFRLHVDGDAADLWSSDEVPASQSANDTVGSGMADDHLNVAVAGDGTLYAAVKTSFDTAGYPKVALLVRTPDGIWDSLHDVDTSGTRPIVVLQEALQRLLIVYTSSEGYNDIVYRESSLTSIAFGPRRTLLTGGLNDVSSTKQNVADELVLLASSSSEAAGTLMTLSRSPDPLASELVDATVSPGHVYYYIVTAFDSIGQESPDSETTSATALAPDVANLEATAISSTEVDLTWDDNATGETGFVVESSLNGVGWVGIATVNADVGVYSDTGLSPGTTHLYRVLATYDPGSSDVSDVASATTLAENHSPVANDDSAQTDMDIAVVIDVLANDTDGEGDTLSITNLTQPLGGSGTVQIADDKVTYVPSPGFLGGTSFTYTANDGTLDSSVATVTVTVRAAVPSAIFYDGFESGGFTAGGWTLSGVNHVKDEGDVGVYCARTNMTSWIEKAVSTEGYRSIEVEYHRKTASLDGGESLTVEWSIDGTVWNLLESTSDTAWSSSSVSCGVAAENQPSFRLRFRSNSDKNKEYTYIDEVSIIGIASSPDTNPPTAQDDSYSTNEDTALTVPSPGVLDNDSDLDGDPLTAVLADNAASGSVVLSSDGSFTYTPDPDFHGVDWFTYKADDGSSQSGEATVTITVAPTNDAPVASDDSYTVEQGQLLSIAAPGVIDNDTDVDGDGLTAVLKADVTDGTLALDPDGSFTYTSDSGFTGTDTFTYVANDGTEDGNEATVSISVTLPNGAPVAADDSYSTSEDTALNVPSLGVLGNDSDPELDPLTAVLVDDATSGNLVLSDDGSFTYTPDPDFHGVDWFTYKADDGTSQSAETTATITVTPTNDAPVASNDSYTVEQGQLLSIAAPGVIDNDTDVDDDGLTAVLSADVTNGTLSLSSDGSFTYEPDSGFTGTDTFTYVANDGIEDSNEATVSISVTPVGGLTVHVESIDLNLVPTGRNTKGEATVLIAPAEANATVVGDWLLDGAPLAQGASGITDATGTALIVSPPEKVKGGAVFTFRVTGITLAGYTYEPGDNLETEASIQVP